MKKCTKCGRNLANDATFCRYCGAPLDIASSTAAAKPSASAAKPQQAPQQPQAAQQKKETTVGGAFMGTFLRTAFFCTGVYLITAGMWPVGVILLILCVVLFNK